MDTHDSVRSRTPVSVVTLLTRAAEDAPDHTALSVKRDGDWVNWTAVSKLRVWDLAKLVIW